MKHQRQLHRLNQLESIILQGIHKNNEQWTDASIDRRLATDACQGLVWFGSQQQRPSNEFSLQSFLGQTNQRVCCFMVSFSYGSVVTKNFFMTMTC